MEASTNFIHVMLMTENYHKMHVITSWMHTRELIAAGALNCRNSYVDQTADMDGFLKRYWFTN